MFYTYWEALVVIYLILIAVIGFWKGWDVVKRVWYWTKKIGWLFPIIVGLVIAAVASGKKNKQIATIDNKIAEAQAKENKTAEDLRKIEKLQEDRKRAEQDIVDITDKYKKKIDEHKNAEPKPGDAGVVKMT